MGSTRAIFSGKRVLELKMRWNTQEENEGERHGKDTILGGGLGWCVTRPRSPSVGLIRHGDMPSGAALRIFQHMPLPLSHTSFF